MEGEEYTQLFPEVTVNPNYRLREEWRLLKPHRGFMKAAGVGGPITGHGAMLGIIDDPFENWAQAQSEVYRKHVWDWYRTTFRTRIWDGGTIVIIMTRWHKADLAGMLLADQPGEWEILRLPAISETQAERDKNNVYLGLEPGAKDPLNRRPGHALCPTRYPLKALLGLKADVGSMGWSSEYQGVPRSAEGNRFKESWFNILPVLNGEALAYGDKVCYWDNAATDDDGCYTAGVFMLIYQGLIYILDVVRGQWSTDERNKMMRNTAVRHTAQYGPHQIYFEHEGGSAGKDAALAIVRYMAGYDIHAHSPSGSKDVRLMPFEAQAEGGNVRLIAPEGCRWIRPYLDELTEMPNGAYRDQGDATSGAYNILALNPTGEATTSESPLSNYRG